MSVGTRRAVVAAAFAPLAWVAALPVLLLGLPFWLVGGLSRGIEAVLRRFEPARVPWRELMMFAPEVGWQPRPNLDAIARYDVDFQLTTDPRGWRDHRSSLDEAEVVVVGDSFAFGMGIDDRDFYGRLARVPVKAVGAPAYSMVHGLLWMERLADALKDKLVCWFIYYGNDPYENLRPNHGPYRMPFVRQAPGQHGVREWEVVTSHVRREPWPVDAPRHYFQRLAELCTPGPLAERAFAASRYLVQRAHALTGKVGARLVVVGIPDWLQLTGDGVEELIRCLPSPAPLDPTAIDRALEGICSDVRVPFVALSQILTRSDYHGSDCHWTAAGHARVARLIEELHRVHHAVEQGDGAVGGDGPHRSRAQVPTPTPSGMPEPDMITNTRAPLQRRNRANPEES